MNCQFCHTFMNYVLMCASCKYLICDCCTSMKEWICPNCRNKISTQCSMIQENINNASSTDDEEADAPQRWGDVIKPTLFGIWLCIYSSIFLIYVLIPCFSFILTNLYSALSLVVYYTIVEPGSYFVLPVFNAIYPYTLEPLIYYGNVVVGYTVIHPFQIVASWTNKYIWELLLLQIYMYIQEFISLIFLLICFVTRSCFSLVKWVISTPYSLYCERSPGIFLDWDSVGFGVANIFLFAMHSLRTILYALLIPTILLSLHAIFVILWNISIMKLGMESLKYYKDYLSQISDYLLDLYEDIFKALAKLYSRVDTELLLSAIRNMHGNYYRKYN